MRYKTDLFYQKINEWEFRSEKDPHELNNVYATRQTYGEHVAVESELERYAQGYSTITTNIITSRIKGWNGA